MRRSEFFSRGHRFQVPRLGGPLCALLVASSATVLAQPAPPSTPPISDPAPTSEPIPARNGRVEVGTLQIAARVGLNFASIQSEFDDGRNTSRTALNVGGSVSYAFTPMLSAAVGIGYSQRGFQIESDFDFDFPTTIELDYFEVPALLRARIALGASPAHLRLEGGINVLFLDAARSRRDGESQSIEATTTGHDVAFVVGLGIDYAFGELIGFAGLRYDFGLVDINNEDAFTADVFNRVAALNIGVAF